MEWEGTFNPLTLVLVLNNWLELLVLVEFLLFHNKSVSKKKTLKIQRIYSVVATRAIFSFGKQIRGSCQNLHLKPQNVVLLLWFLPNNDWGGKRCNYVDVVWDHCRDRLHCQTIFVGKRTSSPWKPTHSWSITDAGDQPYRSFKLFWCFTAQPLWLFLATEAHISPLNSVPPL